MSGVFKEEELKRLEDNYNYRKAIIESMFNKGVPSTAKDIEAINGVLNSMDKSVYDNVTSRLKHQDNANKGAVLSAVAEALKTVSSQKAVVNNKDVNETINEIKLPLDTVEGELDINDRKFTLDEILQEGE